MEDTNWQEETWEEDDASASAGTDENDENDENDESDESDDPFAERRSLELSLILNYDTSSINPINQCYFLISAAWLDTWSAFVNSERPGPPGTITNSSLFKGDGVTLRDDISPVNDYRAVNAVTYYIYSSLYGSDSVAIPRYAVDHRGPEASGATLEAHTRGAKLKAEMEVRKMLLGLPPEQGGMRRAVRPERVERVLCCCFGEDFLARLCECVFTWGRETGVSYKPLGVHDDDDDDGVELKSGSV